MWHSILVALMLQLFTSTLTQDGIQLRTAVDEWLRKSGSETTGFRHALTDLDGDTRTDALVLLRGNAWCGSGGCTLLVFRGSNSGFTFVSKSTIVNEPLRVSSETSSGWKDLIVSAKGFGDVVMQFDGKNYPPVPSNVKASPAQTKAARTVMEPCCVSLYTSDARYESIHEQGLIKVQDGPYLHISLDDVGGLNPEDVLKWQTGRRLLVVYTSEQGAALLDPQTLKSASILDGLSEHPIDVLAERCFQSEAQTTAEMVHLLYEGPRPLG